MTTVAARISAAIVKTMTARIANANPLVLAAPANLKKNQSAIVRLDVALMVAAVKKGLISAKTTAHAVNLVQLPPHALAVAVPRPTKKILNANAMLDAALTNAAEIKSKPPAKITVPVA